MRTGSSFSSLHLGGLPQPSVKVVGLWPWVRSHPGLLYADGGPTLGPPESSGVSYHITVKTYERLPQ
ncbi:MULTISPECIES: hypothetical protein [Cyanophyceae]|uniref:hypothetical protein n=1 Tax=Cyanophyceae TaxID=3028117 RepID=UPI001687A72C|nr:MULTISPECIES: hypothetical protein [Cyanophyceae]MBD1914489.1 hypothetical protein [Phormidium sp. FACHB-77]MBD2031062.1 hypothetical protein [Phormidium sp. FACHB-322]MBD2052105.1 hypothetical protein [Leptolyngbya sp. FACHB-60]